MRPYFLSRDSYICFDHRYCVILDVQSDKYMAIARQTMEHLAPCLSGWPTEPTLNSTTPVSSEMASIADELLHRGTLTDQPDRGKPFRTQDIPRVFNSLLADCKSPPFRSTVPYAGAIVHSALSARYRLSRHSLLSTINAIITRRESRDHSSKQIDLPRARFLVEAFNRWLVLHSRPNACLLDSLSLLLFLARFEIFPFWVFGVISEPFHAHCWLQCGNTVFNDCMAHVSQYTPIMLV